MKRSESGMIVEPVTLPPDDLVADALELMARYHISGVPITDDDGVLVGILTNRDLRFETDTRAAGLGADDRARPRHRAGRDDARRGEEILHRHKIEKLPVVDAEGRLKGLITVKDIQKRIEFPHATKDEQGRLRVGAAVGVGADALERAGGARRRGRRRARRRHRARPLARRARDGAADQGGAATSRSIAGNIATAEAAEALIDAGADAVKVGHRARVASARRGSSPASACRRSPRSTTAPRSRAAHGVPVIADGGMHLVRRHRQGDRGRRRHGHARLAARRHRREPRRRHPRTRASGSRSTAAWARSAR